MATSAPAALPRRRAVCYARSVGASIGTVLVAGATGSLGRHVVAELLARGERVRILSRRDPSDATSPFSAAAGRVEAVRGDVLDPPSLLPACAGVEAVVSCVGASLDLYAWRDRRSYTLVDGLGNLALLQAARTAGVGRFAYVSVFARGAIERTAYVRAHRRVEEALATSGLDWRAIRPTGFFGFLDELVRMAARGLLPVIGDGKARTNPVAEQDLAAFVASAFDRTERVTEIGGPDALSREEMALLAAHAVGRRARIVRSSPRAWLAGARLLARAQPRLSELFEFAAVVSTNDAVAEARGTRRLEDRFREVAAALRGPEGVSSS